MEQREFVRRVSQHVTRRDGTVMIFAVATKDDGNPENEADFIPGQIMLSPSGVFARMVFDLERFDPTPGVHVWIDDCPEGCGAIHTLSSHQRLEEAFPFFVARLIPKGGQPAWPQCPRFFTSMFLRADNPD